MPVARSSIRLAAIASAASLALVACGGSSHKAVGHPRTQVTSPTTAAHRAAAPPTCPLTGQAPPGGKVPQRPALAVKVENTPAARPQYGLVDADVVYEEPVEGGITRFIAIYQCHDASRIEPVRSGRLMDPDVVRQYGAHPLFAYAGAIPWVVTKIDNSSLIDVGIYRAGNAFWRDNSRSAPHNLVASTASLYAAGAAQHAPAVPPAPVFSYGALPAGATPAGAVSIGWTAAGQAVNWTWSAARGVWYRSYPGYGPASIGEGGQIAAANVVVMKAVMYATPYVEDATGAHENSMILTGSGAAQVFRNGVVINGSWKRPSLATNTQLLTAGGRPIALNPGPTWVELVPTTVGVSVTP